MRDLDMPGPLSRYPNVNSNSSLGLYYNDKSEGINFGTGFDFNSLRVLDNSLLYSKGLTTNKNNEIEKIERLIGSGGDLQKDDQLLGGFSILAKAKGTTFTWTGGLHCATGICDFGQGNTISINHYLFDSDNKTIKETLDHSEDDLQVSATYSCMSEFDDDADFKFNSAKYDGTGITGSSYTTTTNDLGKDHTLDFYYIGPSVTVKYMEEGTTTEIKSTSTTRFTIGQNMSITPDTDITYNNQKYRYTGSYTKDSNAKTNGASVTVTYDKKNHTVTFWYKLPKITVRYRSEEDLTKDDLATKEELKFTNSTEMKVTNNHKTITGYVPTGSTKDSDTKTTSIDNISVSYNGNDHTVTFWYKTTPKTTVYYKREDTGAVLADSEELEFTYNTAMTVGNKHLSITGYTLTGSTKDNESKTAIKDKVSITYDSNNHTVTFWYKKQQTKVTIKYVLLTDEKANLSTGTDVKKSDGTKFGDDSYVFKDNETSHTFNATNISTSGVHYEILSKSSKDGITGTATSYTITDDGNEHTIIFSYMQNVYISVIGVCEKNRSIRMEFETSVKYHPNINKTFNASDYKDKWKNYSLITSGNNMHLIEGCVGYSTDLPPTTPGPDVKDKVAISVKVEEFKSQAHPNNDKFTVVVYFDPNFTIKVNHVYIDPITKAEKTLETGTPQMLIPNMPKTVSSKSVTDNIFSGYKSIINLKYKINNVETKDGTWKYGRNAYNITFTPDEGNYEINFYYTSQVIEIEHKYDDGTPIISTQTKILDPEIPEDKLPKEIFIHYKLNDDENTVTPVRVPIKPGIEKQSLIFIYSKPNVFIDNAPADLECGITADDMYNQYIDQNGKRCWVLDEQGSLTIKYANNDTVGLKTGGSTATIIFPFDVIVDGHFIKAGDTYTCTLTEGTPTTKTSTNDGKTYNIYTSKVGKIRIPLWTEEKAYTKEANPIRVSVSQDFNINTYNKDTKEVISTNKQSRNDSGKANVDIVGAIYDFSVTNIDGSDRTGDVIWKASLITNPLLTSAKKASGAVEYKTGILPIGQSLVGTLSQQNTKYNYGIKKGTTFYFSMNTKGAKSTSVEITPKFYYYNKDGAAYKGNVRLFSGNTEITNLTRTSALRDSNRTTSEFQNELSSGTSIYGANNYSNAKPQTFANGKITIGRELRMPFMNYGKDGTFSTKYHEKLTLENGIYKYFDNYQIAANELNNKIYKNASHWYADYVIPNNVRFYQEDGKTLLPQDGFVVVAFSIKTNAGTSQYLAYNLDTPFNQSTAQSEWAYEGAPATYTLPNTATLKAKSVSPWMKESSGNAVAYAPVVIYGNQSTTQNVDSTGTH